MFSFKHARACLCALSLALIMFIQQAHAISIPFTLGWHSNNEADIKGYHIYLGTSSKDEDFLPPIVVKHVDEPTMQHEINEYIFPVEGEKYRLVEGRTYWISLSAYDLYHNESTQTEPIPVYIDQIASTTSTTTSIKPYTTTSIKPDEKPPRGTITINQGNETTNSQVVMLTLSAEDDAGGMGEGSQMSFSNDNKHWSNPEAFLSTSNWILTPGEGEKTVYAKFSDAEGNWTDESVSDSIELKFFCPKPQKLDATALESSGSAVPSCSADKTLDGKTNTGWLSPLRRAVQDEHIIIDLGEKKLINQIDICSNPFLWLNLFPHNFNLQVSTDTETWEELFPLSKITPLLLHTQTVGHLMKQKHAT